jgi:hypothetical protein
MILFSSLHSSFAEGVAVPAEFQAELLAKLVPYDRNFRARATDPVLVLITMKAHNAESENAAAAMKSALTRVEKIGGLAHREAVVPFDSATALAQRCRHDHVSLLYVAPGLDDQVEALAAALSGADLLSVSAVADDVPHGIVLGFEVSSGKPKLVVNLAQAKKQNVAFGADVLSLMRVYR